MNLRLLSLISAITCALGIFICCIMQEWIIVYIPSRIRTVTQFLKNKENKNVTLYFWNNHRWRSETDSLVWSSDVQENIKTIVTRWLDLLHEEQHLPLNVTLQSIILSQDKTVAYLSFTTSPFNCNVSTYENLLFIKSMMRTLYHNKIPLKSIMLLENHKPIEHAHLDFTQPWPLYCLDNLQPNR